MILPPLYDRKVWWAYHSKKQAEEPSDVPTEAKQNRSRTIDGNPEGKGIRLREETGTEVSYSGDCCVVWD